MSIDLHLDESFCMYVCTFTIDTSPLILILYFTNMTVVVALSFTFNVGDNSYAERQKDDL